MKALPSIHTQPLPRWEGVIRVAKRHYRLAGNSMRQRGIRLQAPRSRVGPPEKRPTADQLHLLRHPRWRTIALSLCLSLPLLTGKNASADFASADKYTRLVANQIGYSLDADKTAVLYSKSDALSGNWQLRRTNDNSLISSGQIKNPRADTHTDYFVYQIDFSAVNTSGEYRLHAGPFTSYPFELAANPYQNIQQSLLRSYYLQRCGVEISDSVTGLHHALCHHEDGRVSHRDDINAANTVIAAHGGWHDAGDYGKYVATTAVVIQDVLTRYERHRGVLQNFNSELPPKKSNLPDLLAEMRIGLDWMLRMQRADGAVYRKIGGKKWSKLVSPEFDQQQRYLYGVTSPETAKAAAAWALAARLYQDHDAILADDYLSAARRAWAWLDQQTDMVWDFHEGDNSGSGPYSITQIDNEFALTHDRDDRFAAAVEMYLTTGEKDWLEIIENTLPMLALEFFEWKNVSVMGMFSLRWHPAAANLTTIHELIDSKLAASAEQAMARVNKSPFRLANHRFVWGSNKMIAAIGSLLYHAARSSNQDNYRQAAYDQLHYLLGRNPLNISFVTGHGTRAVNNVSHMIQRGTGQRIPGLMVGGANELAQAGFATKNAGPLSYADVGGSYATNEYAIDYNSALITLIWDLTLGEEWYSPLQSASISQADD